MTLRAYGFLNDSFLFDQRLIRDEFRSLSDEVIQKELFRYREFCMSQMETLMGEVRRDPSSLKLFSGVERTKFSLLKQSALYAHQYLIDDPLLHFSVHESNMGNTIGTLFDIKKASLDRANLVSTIHFLQRLAPMVKANFVKLLPVSVAFEPPPDIPFTYSEDRFESMVPAAYRDVFLKRADVASLKKVEGGWTTNGELFPSRAVRIAFRGHGREMIYFLADLQDAEPEDNGFRFSMQFPNTPPDEARFEVWVQQSVNRSAGEIFNQTVAECLMTRDLEATFSTRSELLSELFDINPGARSLTADVANVFLKLNLPFIDTIDPEALMRVRQHEGEAFENFRTQLDKQLSGLRMISDPTELRIKAENAIHELTEIQVRDVENKFQAVKDKARLNVATAITGLTAAIKTAGLSLLAVAAAAVKGSDAFLEYRKEVKRHPAYFLWKIQRG